MTAHSAGPADPPAATEPTFYVVCKKHGNITSNAMNLQPFTSRVICPYCLCDWLCRAFPVTKEPK